jgi:hypothetical protein
MTEIIMNPIWVWKGAVGTAWVLGQAPRQSAAVEIDNVRPLQLDAQKYAQYETFKGHQ